jgi:uncharacterized protein YndB with AHSA1/START domain
VIEMSRTGVFHQPLEVVFDFLADATNEARWNPECTAARRVSAGEIGRGSRFALTVKHLGALDVAITEYQRPERLAFEIRSSRADMRATFRFSAEGQGTAAAVRMEVRPKGALRFAAGALKPLMEHEFAGRFAKVQRGLDAYAGA